MRNNRRITAIAGFAMAMALGMTAGHALEGEILNDSGMRIGPNGDFPLVGRIPEGADVDVNGCTARGGWCVVRFGGRHGWVEQANVRITGISKPADKFPDAIVVISVDAFYPHGYKKPYHGGYRKKRNIGASVVPYVVQPYGTGADRTYSIIEADDTGATGGTTIRKRDFDVIKVR
jgi:uncharacterized protein YraI